MSYRSITFKSAVLGPLPFFPVSYRSITFKSTVLGPLSLFGVHRRSKSA
jgi:hypothetical protein